MENDQDLKKDGICGLYNFLCCLGRGWGSCHFLRVLQALLRVALLPPFVCWRLPGFHVTLRKSHKHENKENGRRGTRPGEGWSLTSTLWMRWLISFITAVRGLPMSLHGWPTNFSISGLWPKDLEHPLLSCIFLLQTSLTFPFFISSSFLSFLLPHSILYRGQEKWAGSLDR